ncbi:MAG: DUF2442 domain-containing protein [Candidatus Electrothrix sp. YB6]
MYTVDGIAYAGEPQPLLRVVSVHPLNDWKLRLRFSTEEVKIFDFSPLLDDPGFKPLQDETVFRNVSLEHGVPVWCSGQIDIAPEKLYQGGISEDNPPSCDTLEQAGNSSSVA